MWSYGTVSKQIIPQSALMTTLSGNTVPQVSITSPQSGASIPGPANINIQASASDSHGIVRVTFFEGTTRIAEDTASPYAATVSNLGAGSYTFTANAMDTAGAIASASIAITVTGGSGSFPDASTYTIEILPPPAVGANERWWKLIKFRHLSGSENVGMHNLFAAFYYQNGIRVEQSMPTRCTGA